MEKGGQEREEIHEQNNGNKSAYVDEELLVRDEIRAESQNSTLLPKLPCTQQLLFQG